MKLIRRNIEIRASEEESSRRIEGCAVIFNSWSRDLGGFKEIVRQEAISEELLQSSDIIANINHDDNQMVARWKRGSGTLNLELREDGLYFIFEAPKTVRGDELLWNLRTGNLSECSFCFSLPDKEAGENWYNDENGELRREITHIDGLYDVSIVTFAAYPETSVDNREFDKPDVVKIQRNLDKIKSEKEEIEEKNKREEIINNLDTKIHNFYKNIQK